MRGGRSQEVSNITIRLGNFGYFGILVAEERWSLTRGGRNRRFDCILKDCFLRTNCKDSLKINFLKKKIIVCITISYFKITIRTEISGQKMVFVLSHFVQPTT